MEQLVLRLSVRATLEIEVSYGQNSFDRRRVQLYHPRPKHRSRRLTFPPTVGRESDK
jgi:hypothetical protein